MFRLKENKRKATSKAIIECPAKKSRMANTTVESEGQVNLTSIAKVIFAKKTPRSTVDDLLTIKKRKTTRHGETYLVPDPQKKENKNYEHLRGTKSFSFDYLFFFYFYIVVF